MAVAHLVEVLTALALGGSVVGGGVRALAKLTRLVDAVERLSASMEHVVSQIGEHEKRLAVIEAARVRREARS